MLYKKQTFKFSGMGFHSKTAKVSLSSVRIFLIKTSIHRSVQTKAITYNYESLI